MAKGTFFGQDINKIFAGNTVALLFWRSLKDFVEIEAKVWKERDGMIRPSIVTKRAVRKVYATFESHCEAL